jgi:flagellar biosynthesis protein FlhF
MKLYTFTGNSPAEALKKAQNSCGKDAIVVSTKELKKKSLTSPAVYEVVVALEDNSPITDHKKDKDIEKEVVLDISNQAKKLSAQIPHIQRDDTLSRLKRENSQTDLKKLRDDIEKLHLKLNNLQEILWEERSKKDNSLIIPPEFAKIDNIVKRSGMAKEHIEEIIKRTIELMPPYMKSDPKTVERYFQVLLKKMIGIRIERDIPKGEKKVVMLVGPTGVGKTTTIAKLSARFSFLRSNYRVGLISLDSYRIGAQEQLFQYAQMMKLPIEDVIDSSEFIRALNSLSYCDLILIDTMGSSQYDRDKIYKVAKLIETTDREIDVHLVVAAPTKLEDLRDIYENFSIFKLDTLIVTKFDETNSFGNIFSLSIESRLPLSYFSTGQEVPDDLMPASSDFLIECIFNGFRSKEVQNV